MDVASGVTSTGGPGRTSLRGATGESLLGDSPDFLSGSERGTAQMHRQ